MKEQSAKWTREPWTFEGGNIWSPDARANIAAVSELRATDHVRYTPPDIGSMDLKEIYENGRRIVACVNACAGMSDPSAEIARLRAKCEAQESALRDLVESYDSTRSLHGRTYDTAKGGELFHIVKQARAAIAIK